MGKKQDKQVIGWREWVELPEWGITLRGKADTGAKSSAIDCSAIVELPNDRVRFTLHLSREKNGETLTLEAPIVQRKNVRSSTGHGHDRIFIETTLSLCGRQKKILLSLSCRKKMQHRMLIGREALGGDFLVDSGVDHWATPRDMELN